MTNFAYLTYNELLVHSGDMQSRIFQLVKFDGTAIDLTDKTVTLIIRSTYGGEVREVPCSVSPPATGGIIYILPREDTWRARDISYSGHFKLKHTTTGAIWTHPDSHLSALKITVNQL